MVFHGFLIEAEGGQHVKRAIYQTREKMFHRDIQTPRKELKTRRAGSNADEIQGVR